VSVLQIYHKRGSCFKDNASSICPDKTFLSRIRKIFCSESKNPFCAFRRHSKWNFLIRRAFEFYFQLEIFISTDLSSKNGLFNPRQNFCPRQFQNWLGQKMFCPGKWTRPKWSMLREKSTIVYTKPIANKKLTKLCTAWPQSFIVICVVFKYVERETSKFEWWLRYAFFVLNVCITNIYITVKTLICNQGRKPNSRISLSWPY